MQLCLMSTQRSTNDSCIVIMLSIYFAPILSADSCCRCYLHCSTIANTVNSIDFTLTFIHSSIQMNYLWIALKRAMDQYEMK